MKNEERKSPRTGAYLPYVTARGLELDKVIRQIARFLIFEDEYGDRRILLPIVKIGH